MKSRMIGYMFGAKQSKAQQSEAQPSEAQQTFYYEIKDDWIY